MAILTFLFQLAGATMLLLFAVRMVRTGIERAFGSAFKEMVTAPRPRLRTAALGLLLAIVLQSSAAVALLVAGFAGAGGLAFGTGLAAALGADLGSALLIQILSLKLDALAPLLLAVGGFLFLKTEKRSLRQAGRIILGIAFILVALRFLRETMEPIRDSGVLPALSAYLEKDFITAFISGAALAFVMHSSVAAILMCVTVVAIGALPLGAGISLLLGANLGSALIPVWLSRDMEPAGRRIPIANLALRGSAAILAVLIFNLAAVDPFGQALPPAQELVLVHIGFNVMVLLVGLPLAPRLEVPLRSLFPDPPEEGPTSPTHHRSFLDPAVQHRPAAALASMRREVLRMEQVVEEMVAPAMELYSSYDKRRMQAIRAKDLIVNEAFDDIRRYASGIGLEKMSKAEEKELRELLEFAIALEAAGDIVAKGLTALATEKNDKNIAFSEEGLKELAVMHTRVMHNLDLAARVLVSNDPESARLLLSEKDEMRVLHRATRKKHLRRLSAGETTSLESSDVHLETAHSLKEINSQIASIAYPILFREGQLLDTRLINRMDESSSAP